MSAWLNPNNQYQEIKYKLNKLSRLPVKELKLVPGFKELSALKLKEWKYEDPK